MGSPTLAFKFMAERIQPTEINDIAAYVCVFLVVSIGGMVQSIANYMFAYGFLKLIVEQRWV